jgi:hypothetical protein
MASNQDIPYNKYKMRDEIDMLGVHGSGGGHPLSDFDRISPVPFTQAFDYSFESNITNVSMQRHNHAPVSLPTRASTFKPEFYECFQTAYSSSSVGPDPGTGFKKWESNKRRPVVKYNQPELKKWESNKRKPAMKYNQPGSKRGMTNQAQDSVGYNPPLFQREYNQPGSQRGMTNQAQESVGYNPPLFQREALSTNQVDPFNIDSTSQCSYNNITPISPIPMSAMTDFPSLPDIFSKKTPSRKGPEKLPSTGRSLDLGRSSNNSVYGSNANESGEKMKNETLSIKAKSNLLVDSDSQFRGKRDRLKSGRSKSASKRKWKRENPSFRSMAKLSGPHQKQILTEVNSGGMKSPDVPNATIYGGHHYHHPMLYWNQFNSNPYPGARPNNDVPSTQKNIKDSPKSSVTGDPQTEIAPFAGPAYYYYDPIYGYIPYPYYHPYWYNSNPSHQGYNLDHSLPKKEEALGRSDNNAGTPDNGNNGGISDIKNSKK